MNTWIKLTITGLTALSACQPSATSEKQYEAVVVNPTIMPASALWKGNWERNQRMNSASLEVLSVEGDSIKFNLFSSSGGHTGEITEEYAKVVADKAVYTHPSGDLSEENCRIEFTLLGDTVIVVDHQKGECFRAMGVTYSGRYLNPEYAATLPKREETLFTTGILNSKTQDSLFHLLTGEDYYLFLNSSQLSSEDEDLDHFNATVHASGVRGMFIYMENIIMITPDGKIWAAVIDQDMNVRYYTNTEEYKNKLPVTIDKWRERFKDYKIIYN